MDWVEFLTFFLIGFCAQIIDGAISMMYGLISMTILLTFGMPPAYASASVHISEIFTTGFSGLSHAMFKNINLELFRRLVIPGVIGSVLGAILLSFLPAEPMKAVIAIYLTALGVYIFYKSLNKESIWKKIRSRIAKTLGREELPSKKLTYSIGFAGGFCDSMGGGGWGAVVSGSLIAEGTTPRYTIGSTILAEFLVTTSSSIAFFFTIGVKNWIPILGLICGGVLAAPLGAYFVKHIKSKFLIRLVSFFVILTSIRLIVSTFL
jgi:uncharacterized protein